MQTEGQDVAPASAPALLDRWILSRMHRMLREVETHFATYRLDLASQALYEFLWNEYCDWYLEFTKPTMLV